MDGLALKIRYIGPVQKPKQDKTRMHKVADTF